jgi:hypothetical protein
MTDTDYIINLYTKYKSKAELENLIDIVLNFYYDNILNDIYPYVKKSMVVTLFFRDIDTILIKQHYKKKKKICICYSNKKENLTQEQINKYIYDFITNNKLPIFIYDILKLYRMRNIISIQEIKSNPRSPELFILIKYEKHDIIITEKIKNMSYHEKIDILKKIIKDIENI